METAILDNTLQQWIEQSRLGDREAFGHIVRKYQGIVSGVVYGILGDFHKAEDLTQETFLTAWNKLDELREIEKLPAWLCGIARNRTKKYLQRNAKHATVAILTDDMVSEFEDSENPVKALIREERNRRLWSALEKIPEKYRIPLILYYRSEKSIPEIAKTLNLTEETLYVQLTRARKYLRRELEKQIEGTIAASGPNELFSLAVVAALPAIAAFAPAEKAVAATATAAAAPVVFASGSSCSGSGCSAAPTTFGGILQSIIAVLCITCMWFFLAIGAIPGVWYAVRNAPTLKARQFLVLTSLRLHFLFGAACCFGFSYSFFHTMLTLFINASRYMHYGLSYEILNQCFYIGCLLFAAAALGVLTLSSLHYRRILKQSSSPEQKELRLSRSFCVYGIGLSALYLFTIFGFYLNSLFAPDYRTLLMSWEGMIRSYMMQFIIVGFLFLLVSYFTHRRFLAIAKDEQSYNAAPPIITQETPFFQRVVLQWTVSFALFLTAGLIVIFSNIFLAGWIPRTPIVFEGFLLALFFCPWGAAVLGTRFPSTLFLWNLLGIAIIVCCGISCVYWGLSWGGLQSPWNHFPLKDFFDSPNSWPLIFGVFLLNAITIFTIFTTLVLSVVYLFRRAKGKTVFLSRPTITKIFTVGTVLILLSTPFWYSYAKRDYLATYLFIRSDKSASKHHAQKMLVLVDEVEKIGPKNNTPFAVILKIQRSKFYVRLGEYDQAIANLDNVIELVSKEPQTKSARMYLGSNFNRRGEAKFLKNDWEGAKADFDRSLELHPHAPSALYNRGYLHEKLGETELAVADYDEVIKDREQFQFPPPVVSMIPRSENDKMKVQQYNVGYVVSLEKLKEIRDQLSKAADF